MKIFIATSFDNSLIKNNKKKIYATDFEYYKKNFSLNKVIQNDWENHKKLNNDFIKLNKTIKKLELIISAKLSKLHKNISPKIFKKIIQVWLTCYVQSYYFKWKIINYALKSKKKIYFTNIGLNNFNIKCIDTKDYLLKLRESDYYNYYHYLKIFNFLKNLKPKKIFFINKKKIFSFKENKIKNFNIFFWIFCKIEKLFIKNKIIFFLETQNKFFYINICKIFNQLPFKINNLFNWNKYKHTLYEEDLNLTILEEKNFNYPNLKFNKFEKFLIENFHDEIPKCYTLNFKSLKNYVDKIRMRPKIVFTFFGHIYNEFFKLWILLKKKYNLLYIVEHGGHHQKIRTMNTYEYDFGKGFISWTNLNKKNTKSLPVINYYNTNYLYSKEGNNLLYVPVQKHKYVSRINHGPQSNYQNYSLNNIEILKKFLFSDIFKNLYFSPKQIINDDQRIFLEKYIIKNNILEPFQFRKAIKDARLVICSYPQTAFIDSMMLKPTILVYKKNLWPHLKTFNNVYNLMIKNKIAFFDAKKACEHVNRIWENPLEWWLSKNVRYTREKFFQKFNINFDEKNCLKKWTTFINSEIKKK